MADAALSGRLPASGVERLHNLYRKLHAGKLDGLEDYLDAKFRKGFRHPLHAERYKPTTAQAKESNARIVLTELVTGAGCEPCTAVDLAFDAELERYTRNELVLLVYHMHAPVSDPMSNHSAEARHTFYGTNGAPTIYLDGQNIKPGEGLRTETERVYANLDAAVAARLNVAAQASLKLDAKLDGPQVKVAAAAEQIKEAGPDVRLQIALVENEVSYSGENGLRFHPMVVRNLARATGQEEYGFAINPAQTNKVEYAFNLDEITAANLKYYDEYIARMKKRLGENFEISFREKRYVMNPAKLAVVAFLQDVKTKQILQTTYLRVVPSSKAARN